jgi:hypothetical protein
MSGIIAELQLQSMTRFAQRDTHREEAARAEAVAIEDRGSGWSGALPDGRPAQQRDESATAVDMTPDIALQLQVIEADLVAFKAWLAEKGIDPVLDARIEVTDGDRRSLRHARRPGACHLERDDAGAPWRVWWTNGLYVQECERYRLVYRAHDEEAC